MDDEEWGFAASGNGSRPWARLLYAKYLLVAAAMFLSACSAHATAGASRYATSASPAPPAFSDLGGAPGAMQIAQVARLGTLDSLHGSAFEPYEVVTRRVFVRWLFKTNNAIFADDSSNELRASTTTDKPAFSDVDANDRDYQYIQAMHDAKIAVGFPDKTFRPDEPLTREQMFSMKLLLDSGGARLPPNSGRPLPPWKDRASVAPEYVRTIVGGMYGSNADTIGRVYGATPTICPKKLVTRAEAAIALWRIGAHTYGQSRDAVAASASSATSTTTQ